MGRVAVQFTLGERMRGQFTFKTADPERSAARYVELLSAELHAAKPLSMEVDGYEIRVRGGAFRLVWNINLLVPPRYSLHSQARAA